ncbi:MAG: ATP-binding protein [Myxococcota bacterium]
MNERTLTSGHTIYVVGPTPRPIPIEAQLVVGRGAECDLRFSEDRRMSRRHARFVVDDGVLHIEDLGGINGTHVNEVPVKGRLRLNRGDVVKLGKTELKVGTTDAESPTRPDLVKPADRALPPDLDRMVVDEFYAAIGLGDQTLVDARSSHDIVHQSRRLAVLNHFSTTVQRADSIDVLLNNTLQLLLKVLPADRAFIALVDDDGTPTSVVSQGTGINPQPANPLSTTVTDYVVHRRTSIISRDTSSDARFDQSRSLMLNEAHSIMASPIIQGDPVVGIIALQSSHLRPRFEEPDVDLITIVGAMVGQAMAKLQMAQKREETIRALETARADLLRTQQELIRSQQMAAIGRLAAGIAHEVKNHLSPFMLADMIAQKYPSDEDIQEAKSIMLEARQHILDLVNEVRNFVSGADVDYRLEVTDLAEVVRGVLRFMQCDKVIKEAEVNLDVRGEPLVELDAPRFRQVLINLIRNAADAVPATRRARIALTIEETPTDAIVRIADNGRGVEAAVAERLFEPFFTTKGGQGLGLGLDISRKIVAAHGGNIDLASTSPQGTIFCIRLPLVAL